MDKFVKKIDSLSPEQASFMGSYAQKWIDIGLKTGATDWQTFDKYMPICYEKTNLIYPSRVIRVPSPFFGAHVASLAHEIWNKRYKNVEASVRDSVRSSVEASVEASVGDSVGDSVRSSVEASVRSSVRDSVRSSVRDSYEKEIVKTIMKLAIEYGVTPSWNYWLGGQFWVGYWFWGVAFVNFFFDICKLKLTEDIMERAEAYRKVSESVNYIWLNRDFILVCERPIAIHRNEQGRLHNVRGKSIMYPDGWGLYHLNGVQFSETEFKKAISGPSLKELLTEFKDIDQRTQALRFCKPQDMISHAKGELIDEVSKLDINGEPVNWKLYKFPKGEIFTQDAYYCLMDCPSTGKQHFEGVEVSKTVAEAMCWAENNLVTEEEWLRRVPLLHEN